MSKKLIFGQTYQKHQKSDTRNYHIKIPGENEETATESSAP